ncbi:hypothetical protein EJ04DRAFT_486176 [Polyplosphaeria fusca]|uniref:DUF8004 domain-containing protein n=1 Tax=Polyplosphaeria fusca TaxID=682080 RepID=A0A9P4R2U9_9PLEO|nr:hypothetical protein EJ04DRAFT_486176 [Polyplosphaeria fusca]
MDRRSASCAAPVRNSMRTARVKRWVGATRSINDWDGLRRDPELWFDNGDCLVHLYARGQSRRGPSFRVPFKALRKSKCGAMFSLCFAQVTSDSASPSKASRRVSSGLTAPVSMSNTCELYIPAPDDASRESAFQWHITTRNFFAFVFRKPLVGAGSLGQALVNLQERMHLFRSGQINNHEDFLKYAEDQGYRDFVDCPDYALAMLQYAEHYKLRDIYIDAFAHCVGMNGDLSMSAEFEPTSRLTKALITRAYLEVDIHLGRVMLALTNFLDDDLSPALLGLADGARAHLERFRSFMHGFYVEKFGYWPPPQGSPYSKALYKSMYFDLKSLYDYLVDSDSTSDLTMQKPASGGICVLQNVQAFDSRHKFTPLPHPLPLLPQYETSSRRTQSQKALRTLTLGSKQAKTDRYMTTRAALTSATNTRDITVTSSQIVQAYMRFERQCALNNQRDEKVSMADARKVRWFLIYGTLQYLVSALRAPKEVRDTERPLYPLCCLVPEQPPWEAGTRTLNSPAIPSVNVPEAINSFLSESNCDTPNELTSGASTATIQPDCQKEDYFTHTNTDASRPVSVEVPAPLRISTPSRRSSIRSFKPVSLSALSSRRNSFVLKSPPQPFYEIIVQGYGNGLNAARVDPPSQPSSQPPSQPMSRTGSVTHTQRSSKPTLPEGAGPETSRLRSLSPDKARGSSRPTNLVLSTDVVLEQARTPTFDSFHMDQIVSPVHRSKHSPPPSSSESTISVDSPFWSDGASSISSASSTAGDLADYKPNIAGSSSSLLGGLVSIESTPKATPKRSPSIRDSVMAPPPHNDFQFSFDFPQTSDSTDLAHRPESRQSRLSFSFDIEHGIGVALSGPPSPTIATPFSPSLDSSPPHSERPRPLSRSFSMESIMTLKSKAPKPARKSSLQRPSVPPKKPTGGGIDIFAALSLGPAKAQLKGETAVSVSKKEDEQHDQLDAAPPPISKSKMARLEVEERSRKKEKRMSLGSMLRRW